MQFADHSVSFLLAALGPNSIRAHPLFFVFVFFVLFVVAINFVCSVVQTHDHSERKYFASTAVCARHSWVLNSFQLCRPLYSLCSEKIPS